MGWCLKIGCFLILLAEYSTWCREYAECQGIQEPDVVVPSKRDCAKYIFCDGENSYEGACLPGNYFNGNTGACEDAANVKCDVGRPHENGLEGSQQQATESGQELNVNEDAEGGAQVSANAEDQSAPAAKPNCADTKALNTIKHVANPESCVAFYTCYNGRAIPMLCAAGMYFNANSGRCEPQTPNVRCKAPYSTALSCHKGVYDFVPHPYRCEYYFYCANGYLLIMRCPSDSTWDYERATCVHNSTPNCYFGKLFL